MRFWRIALILTALTALVLTTAVSGFAAVTEADVTRLKTKVANQEMLTPADIALAEEINAETGSKIDIKKALERAKNPDYREANRPHRPTLDEYVWSEITYSFHDISEEAGVVAVTMTDDDMEGPFPLGFNFEFYGDTYNEIKICSNGFLTFNATATSYNNQAIPSTDDPNGLIAPFWDDLNPADGGMVYYWDDPAADRFIVQWDGLPGYVDAGEGPQTFQAILLPQGIVEYHYETINGNNLCTVGIENEDGTEGLQVCFNGAGWLPTSGSAIMIGEPDGVPNPVTNFTLAQVEADVVASWVDPTEDTNGNPLTPDNIEIWLGVPGVGTLLGTVAVGVQSFTHVNAPDGNLTYYVRAYADPYYGEAVSEGIVVGDFSYFNDFDVTDGMWVPDPATAGWEWGIPTDPDGPAGAYSEPNVWGTILGGDYPIDACFYVTLNPELAVESAGATFEFWGWYDTEANYDGCNFKVSIDGGETWIIAEPEGGYPDVTNEYNVCIPEEPAWTGHGQGFWENIVIPLGQFVGEVPMFRFSFGSDGSVLYPGFFFDDVMIWGLAEPVVADVSGTITLDGGDGVIDNVGINADGIGNPETHPAHDGTYTLEDVLVGDRLIWAELPGYITASTTITLPEEGLTGVDLTLVREAPPAPTGLDTTWVDHVGGQTRLEWDVSTDLLVDAYNVYRKVREDEVWTYVDQVAGRENSFYIETFPGPGIWNYAVTAVDNDVSTPVESDYSEYVEILYGELPPTMLVANGSFDDHIHLSWFAPGVPPEIEIFYDNGTNNVDGIGWWGGSPTFGWLVARYQSISGPLTVTRLKYYFTGFATDGDPIEIGVFADDGTGTHPTFTPLGVITTTHQAPYDDWHEFELDPPLTFADGIFYAAARQITTNSICVGGDDATTFINNTFFYSFDGTVWTNYEPGLTTIPMQRAFVIGNVGEEVVMAPSAPRGPVVNRTSASFDAFTDENGKWLEAAYQASIPGTKADMTREDRLAMARRPSMDSVVPHMQATAREDRNRSLDQELLYYKVYRDDAFLAQADTNFYDDMVEENIFYDYFVTAYYDNSEESGPTGTVTAAANMAPGMPNGVEGAPLNTTDIRINWVDPTQNADGTPLVDLAGLNVYRDGIFLATVAPGIGYYDDTPPQPNQSYTWSVGAYDEVPNEGPWGSWSGSVVSPWMEWGYEWDDISTVGTPITFSDDDNQGPFDLGFDFTFYGVMYNQIRICSNGFATFTSTTTNLTNTAIPNPEEPNAAIYPLWDDLDPPEGSGQVYYYADATLQRFVIQYTNVEHYPSGDPVTFQVIIMPDGAVYFHYQVVALVTLCTIGVENATGTDAIQLLFDGVGDWIPTNESAVVFWGPTPVYTDVSGTITLDGGAGDITDVDVTVNGVSHPHANPDGTGAYNLTGVQVGTRRFTATLDGYHTTEVVRDVPEAGLTDVDMTLVRLDPPVPTGLEASVETATGAVELNWDDSPDALVDYYNVYRRLRTEVDWVVVQTPTESTVIDTLPVDNIYVYAVTAVDEDVSTPVESEMSELVEVLYGALPPSNLVADGNYDDRIVLSWFEPGVPPEIEVFYDDGTNDVDGIGWWGGQPTFGWLVARYQSIAGPLTVTRLKYYITGFATDGDPIEIGVFADDGTGTRPTFTPLGVITTTHQAPYDEWHEFELDPPLTFTDGIFYAAARQITTNAFCVGGDDETTFINNTFFYSFDQTEWTNYEPDLTSIPMQRAFVIGNAGQEIMMAPSAPRGPIVQRSHVGFENASKSGALAQAESRSSGKLRTADRTAPALDDNADEKVPEHLLRLAGSAEPQPVDLNRPCVENAVPYMHQRAAGSDRRPVRTLDDVVAYHVYKDATQIGSTDDEVRTYTDTPVTENESHSYYVTAEYDDGSISQPSNTVTAMCNMAPGAPQNVNGTPQGSNNLLITWVDPTQNADGTPCVDLQTIRIFRDEGWIANVDAGIGQYVDTPPVNNEFYTWTLYGLDEVPNIGPAASLTAAVQSPWRVVDYEWDDISTVGTPIAFGDDDNQGPFDLGFSVEFYDNTYTQIRICSNGFASFTSTTTNLTNTAIPNVEEPNAAIYPLWDDLDPPEGSGQVYYYADTAEGRFIIQYSSVEHYPSGNPETFQVVISPDGAICFRYQVVSDVADCTIGVEDATGTEALQILFDAAGPWTPTNQTAVEFWGGEYGYVAGVVRETPSLQPVEGVTVTAEETGDFAVSDVGGNYELRLEPGTYTIAFTKPGLCPVSYDDIEVVDENTTVRNAVMELAGAEFDVTSLDVSVPEGGQTTSSFEITNTGNCDIDYQNDASEDWCTCDPWTGTVAEGSSAMIEVTFDATGMGIGDYDAQIQITHGGAEEPASIAVVMHVGDAAEEADDLIPTEFALHQNYPNPFNPSTMLRFDVAKEGHVSIVVFNVLGQEVARPVDAVLPVGRHQAVFTAGDLPSGMYLVKMDAGGFTALNKMVLLK